MKDTRELISVIEDLATIQTDNPLVAESLCNQAGDDVKPRIESLLSYSSDRKIHYVMNEQGRCAGWEECDVVPDNGIGLFKGFTTISSALDNLYPEDVEDEACLVVKDSLDNDVFTAVPLSYISGVCYLDEALHESDEINPITEVMSYNDVTLSDLLGTVALIDKDVSDDELSYLSLYMNTLRRPREFASFVNTSSESNVAWPIKDTDQFMLCKISGEIGLIICNADIWGCIQNVHLGLIMTHIVRQDDIYRIMSYPRDYGLIRVM